MRGFKSHQLIRVKDDINSTTLAVEQLQLFNSIFTPEIELANWETISTKYYPFKNTKFGLKIMAKHFHLLYLNI
jgi:hypothetical protein